MYVYYLKKSADFDDSESAFADKLASFKMVDVISLNIVAHR